MSIEFFKYPQVSVANSLYSKSVQLILGDSPSPEKGQAFKTGFQSAFKEGLPALTAFLLEQSRPLYDIDHTGTFHAH